MKAVPDGVDSSTAERWSIAVDDDVHDTRQAASDILEQLRQEEENKQEENVCEIRLDASHATPQNE